MTQKSTRVAIGLTITLQTPLCVGAPGTSDGFQDKSTQRDGWQRPIIPGSQIKGRIRHSCERIARALEYPICMAPYPDHMCPNAKGIERTAIEAIDQTRAKAAGRGETQCIVCALFGSPVYPSPLQFSDAIYTPLDALDQLTQPVATRTHLRPGVGIDRHRRTALEGVFYLVETTEANISFNGTIHGTWSETSTEEINRMIGLLLLGIRETTRWGGGSSRGLGWAEVEATVTWNDAQQQNDQFITQLAEGVKHT